MAGRQQVVILERLISLSLADLRRVKLFDKTEGYRSLPISISKRNGLYNESYAVRVTVSLQSGNTYVFIECVIDEQPVSYMIPLVEEINYLTGQFTYYFKCTVAGKICRRLYLYQNKWVCRDAITNGCYLQNTLSKNNRGKYEYLKRLHLLESTIAACGKKWFKTYNKSGQHTGRMKKAIRARVELNRINGV